MLAEQILEGHDIYTGMRSRSEFERSAWLFDLVIWVDGSERRPPEPSTSMELTAADADWVVNNNGPEANFPGEVVKLVERMVEFQALASACAALG